jgi:hypothetical protein
MSHLASLSEAARTRIDNVCQFPDRFVVFNRPIETKLAVQNYRSSLSSTSKAATNSLPYSAELLREELDRVDKTYPGHKKIVLIGHSMGGMVSRLMVTDSGMTFWDAYFGKPPDRVPMNSKDKFAPMSSIKARRISSQERAVSFGRASGKRPDPSAGSVATLQVPRCSQQVVFMSDGGENVRRVQEYLHPFSEHLIDWFHITMRLTVLQQQTKALQEERPELHEGRNRGILTPLARWNDDLVLAIRCRVLRRATPDA